VHRRAPLHRYHGPGSMIDDDTRLYDLQTDPGQQVRFNHPASEQRMIGLMLELMKANHAPPEAHERRRLKVPA